MTLLEDRLRDAFARVAAPVVPRPDPLGRLLARRSRRRWRRGLGAVAATFAGVLVGGTLIAAPLGGPARPEPSPTESSDVMQTITGAPVNEWTRRLIDAPTRGNMAGDTRYVERLTAVLRTRPSLFPPIDVALDRVKVLALERVDGALIAVAAHYNDTRAAVTLDRAEPSAQPEDLAGMPLGGMAGPLQPFFFDASGTYRDRDHVDYLTTFALAPAGCQLASSDSASIGLDGNIRRTWQEHGDHLIVPGDRSAAWWRVTCDGKVRFEGPRNLGVVVERPDPSTLSASPPVPGRGSADPAVLERALAAWRAGARQSAADEPWVEWAGTPPGGRPTVVVMGHSTGGATLVGAFTDVDGARIDAFAVYYAGRQPTVGDPSVPLDPLAGFSTATANSPNLVAVRLPTSDASPRLGDRLLVVGPRTATRLLVDTGDGRNPAPVPLTGGVGVLPIRVPAPALTLRAVDGSGAVLAEMRYTEPDANGQFFGEPLIEDW
jgi:hypothetical protein